MEPSTNTRYYDGFQPDLQGINPKQQYGDKKVPLHLVPTPAMVAIAMGLKEGARKYGAFNWRTLTCLLYTSPSPRDGLLSRMPSSA